MLSRRQIELASVCVTVALLLGSAPFARAARAQATLVKVTPLGSHSGELCARDRALLFEDPTGLRILYDPGFTTDETDPRLGDVHVILLSHAHSDHIGISRPTWGGGTCAAPATGAANSSSNVGTIAAVKNAMLVTAGPELATLLGAKIQAIRRAPTPACLTGGLENETTVPGSAPCTAWLGVGGTRTIRRGGGSGSVQITGVEAIHANSIPAALIDPPGLPPGTFAFGGNALGFVVRFTNGLTAYLTGDTGMFSDMEHVIAKFYRPNLVVINIGPGGFGPTSLGPDDAANIIAKLVRPTTAIPSHVGEQATSGGSVMSNTWSERFIRQMRSMTTGGRGWFSTEVVLPLSDVTLTFDGRGRCIGCPR